MVLKQGKNYGIYQISFLRLVQLLILEGLKINRLGMFKNNTRITPFVLYEIL